MFEVASSDPVPPGDHVLRFEFEPQGQPDLAQGHGMPGRFELYVDDQLVGASEVPFTTPFAFNPGALTCGADPGSTVTSAYAAPFRFTGTLHKVTVDLSGELIPDKESELRVAMARQ
jgi:arylsulfatase